jgi:hypothetical protein
MGFVMYIPICMIAISKVRSSRLAFLLMIPLFLPSSIEIVGVNPRCAIALLLIGYLIWRGMDEHHFRLNDLTPGRPIGLPPGHISGETGLPASSELQQPTKATPLNPPAKR